MRRFGPKVSDHDGVGKPCPVCEVPFKAGDYTTLISMEPKDTDEAEKMVAGRCYTAIAAEVHVECAESLGLTVDDS